MKKNKNLIFRLETDLFEFLKELAKQNRSSVSYEIRQLILEKFNKNEKLDN